MLGKYEWQILEEMPRDEFIRWMGLIELEHRERRAERQKLALKNKLARQPGR